MGEFWSGSKYDLKDFQMSITVENVADGSVYSMWPEYNIDRDDRHFNDTIKEFHGICLDLHKTTQRKKPKNFKTLYEFYHAIRDFLDYVQTDDKKPLDVIQKINDIERSIRRSFTYVDGVELNKHALALKQILEDVNDSNIVILTIYSKFLKFLCFMMIMNTFSCV